MTSSRTSRFLSSSLAVAVTIALAGCTNTHDGTTALMNTDCLTCHPDPGNLPHLENKFPLTTVVRNSKHVAIACTDCHRMNHAPGLRGFHTDCTSTCHLQTAMSACCIPTEPLHLGRISPVDNTTPYAWDPVNHDFCLTCHPAGIR